MEWLLSKLELNHPTEHELVLNLLKSMPTVDWLPNDVLLMIFQHVDLKYVKHIPIVCKRWHHLFQTPAFWQPRIHAAIQKVVPRRDYPMPNLFLFRFASLCEKVEWLFHNCCKYRPEDDVIDMSYEETDITFETQNFIGIQTWIDGRKHGPYHFIFLDPKLTGIIEEYGTFNNGKEENDCIVWKLEDGTIFDGQTMKNIKGKFVPHGAGTWRFPDGTVLSGDAVAFDGLPHDGKEWFAGERMTRNKRIKR